MTRLRAVAGVTISVLALTVGTTLAGGALALTPTASSAPTTGTGAGSCPTSGPDASPGMMGGDRGMMGSGPDATPVPSPSAPPAGHDAHHPAASPAVSTAPRPCAAVQGTRIEVTLSDMMRMEPGVMTVPVNVAITFVVHNAGAIRHEFVLGDAAAQQEHELAMQRMGGTMAADDPDAIGVDPGVTKELTWTFTQPGEMIAGCHIPGHYPAGMKAIITVIR